MPLKNHLRPLEDRGPLGVMFLLTSMPVGGAETLLVNLIRRLDRERFRPELCCLKELGPLGEELSKEIPVFSGLIGGKYDVLVWRRLARLFRERNIDAIVTVGAGDKMFWGRLAAWSAGLPVVLSAIHSTGWPDSIGRLNRQLTPVTDRFIGVAPPHGKYLVEVEGMPPEKVTVIPNGVDVVRFSPEHDRSAIRASLGLSTTAPVTGIVAALRPEKNHELFLRAAKDVLARVPDAQFLIVGDGPERPKLESLTAELGIGPAVHFLGTRSDIPQLVAAMDVFALTSHMEAFPVSILEAMATELPVVAPRVGSIPDSVTDGGTGYLFEAGKQPELVAHLERLLTSRDLRARFGAAGREKVVAQWSLERMVEGYQDLIREVYQQKCPSAAVLDQPIAVG